MARACRLVFPALVVAWAGLAASAHGQGVYLSGAGPIHRSIAGASTAAPLDAIGAQYWNPAAIGGLRQSRVDIGSEFVYTDIYLGSTVPAGSIIPSQNFPAVTATGRTRSDNGVAAIPSIGLVYQSDGDPWTIGLGLQAIAGGGINYPSDPANPILAPVGPLQRTILGQQAANLSILQVGLNLAYAFTDALFVGVGPTVNVAGMGVNPPVFAGLNDANGDGLRSFPNATGSRPFWGGGFRVGVYWEASPELALGFGFTSPQWFESFRFNSKDELGNPLRIGFNLTLPMIYSLGVAYKGIENLTLTADVRYFDYQNTQLFGTRVVDGGLGWKDVFALAVGAEYRLDERNAVRLGYSYNENPIPETGTLFNIQVPGIIQHQACIGFTTRITDAIDSSLAYVHAFQNSIQGNILEQRGINTRIQAGADSLLFGLTVHFGEVAPAATGAAPQS